MPIPHPGDTEIAAAATASGTMRLLQLADNCFPSGGFAFSNGLESLAKLGHVKRMEDFRQYLDCHLDQLTSVDLPFLNSAYAAAERFGLGNTEDTSDPGCAAPGFGEVAWEWDAWMFMPSQRRGSLSQGQAWARAMEETFDLASIRCIRPGFLQEGIPLHFLMAFAATLRAGGISRLDGQSLLLHMALRDQLGAAVRLGLLGSLQAQKLHHEYLGVGERYRGLRRDWDHSMAMRAAPMIDLAQASHPNLYSKLFQN